jgi:hypothetical protein
MKCCEIEASLADHGIRVDVRPTPEIFPHLNIAPPHFSVICENPTDQQRVHHWIQFTKVLFKNFDAWAVYIDAIVEKN